MAEGAWQTGCVRRPYFQADARLARLGQGPYPPADSVWATAGRQYARHGGACRALMGAHYRAPCGPRRCACRCCAWPPSRARRGPLMPVQLGGGFQLPA
ncbi:MAG: hypothetical protein WKG07_17510 [Hymenobacter sp.]